MLGTSTLNLPSFKDTAEISSPLSPEKSTNKNDKDFNVVYTDYIGERTGSIRDYYSLLSPPIGSGGFGEVRRAIHLQTNVTRAVKIIKKSRTCKEQQERLINEVNILKKIVKKSEQSNKLFLGSSKYNESL